MILDYKAHLLAKGNYYTWCLDDKNNNEYDIDRQLMNFNQKTSLEPLNHWNKKETAWAGFIFSSILIHLIYDLETFKVKKNHNFRHFVKNQNI